MMRKIAFVLLPLWLLTNYAAFADPIAHKNIEILQLNYGNSNALSTIDEITGSFVQVSAAGNALNIRGDLENASIFQENYGNDYVNANISNISSSVVQVSAIGNSITIE